MATKIKIGHASGSENSENRKDGVRGDQTGSEVLIKDNYDISTRQSPFTVLLRPTRRVLAMRSAAACEAACKNTNVGYGQSDRNTLYTEGKKVNFAFGNITTPCNTDCSAFMTACAVAGGAKFAYAIDNNSIGNAPTCSNMERWFVSCQDYAALKTDQYLTKTDYMQRGDILVDPSAHTVMVLENGCAVPPSIDLKFDLEIVNLQATTIKLKIKIRQLDLETATETEVDTDSDDAKKAFKELLAFYKYTYEVRNLETNTKVVDNKKITIEEKEKEITISNLAPDTSYWIRLIATEKETEEQADDTLCQLSSACKVFKTKESFPEAVKNLNVAYSFDSLPAELKACIISFNAPSSWGASGADDSGYRVSLLVNGQVIAYNDNLITGMLSTFALSNILNGVVNKELIASADPFGYENTIQISVQPWTKRKGNYYFNPIYAACSKPFKLRHFIKTVDKLFINVDGERKRAILHNNLKN